MIQHHTLDTPPTEIRFPRHQIIAEVARNETTANIGKASQSQNPGKEEMDRPVPNRGADDKGKSRTLPTPSPVASPNSSIKRVSQPALIGLLRSSCHRFVLPVGVPAVL